ncbi:MAG: hypothetical protein WC141_07420 [Arcobacteraceae bacterium]
MSQEILNHFEGFNSFRFDPNLSTFIATKHHIDIDIQEMLDITYALENNFIPYKICSGFNIRVLKKSKKQVL